MEAAMDTNSLRYRVTRVDVAEDRADETARARMLAAHEAEARRRAEHLSYEWRRHRIYMALRRKAGRAIQAGLIKV
jgi:hypothetical protein